MQVSVEGFESIKAHEAFRAFAYPDPESDMARACRKRGLRVRWGFRPASELLDGLPPKHNDIAALSAKPWTVGYGETKGVTMQSQVTKAGAAAQLRRRLEEFGTGVLRALTVPPTQNEFDALLSLAYNIGLPAFSSSTVVRAHNRGDKAAAGRAFNLFNIANGKKNDGLVARRAAESAVYLRRMVVRDAQGVQDDEPETELPTQAVEPERSMAGSEINRAGVVAGGTAAVGAVAEAARTVSDVKYSVMSLGDWLLPAALILVVALCGYIIYQRFRQRKEGFA